MTSKYGFLTSEELKQAMAQQEKEEEARNQKEIARIDPRITQVLEDFLLACDLPDCVVKHVNEQWIVRQQEKVLIVANLVLPQRGQAFALQVDDQALADIQAAHVVLNRSKLYGVLENTLKIPVKAT